jgi:hypothetical protein
MRVRIRKPHYRGVDAGLCVDTLGKAGSQRAIASGSDVEDFELRAGADTFRMGPAGERTVLLGGNICLHYQNPLDNLIDDSGFGGQIPVGIAAGDPEPSGQEQHDDGPIPGSR